MVVVAEIDIDGLLFALPWDIIRRKYEYVSTMGRFFPQRSATRFLRATDGEAGPGY